jgi:predicted nucleotidyltransferase
MKASVPVMHKPKTKPPTRRYQSPNIPLSAIRRYVRAVAERFQPERVILFGSYAYGKPNADSDVDLLVVMPARNQMDQAVRICLAVEAPFALDLIVRTPKNLAWRLEEGDWFLREIVSQGRVLYEEADEALGPQGGRRLSRRGRARSSKSPSA